ncbi:MAG: carbohydrate ABC transporter permease [Hyphomicrobiales bacterium]|nr:MAG: carbohydrate ABC transporter permease [Hyphomicrobiales bacterium]
MSALAFPTAARRGRAAPGRPPIDRLWALLVLLPVAALMLVNLLPLVWGVLTSIKPEAVIFATPPQFAGFTPTNAHYERVFAAGFVQSFTISLAYSGAAVALALTLALPAAYAFDRFEFPFRQSLFLLIVASIPLSLGAAALLIPNYVYFVRLGLVNTPFALPLIYAAHQLPMAIWVVKGTIEGIPRELDEAAVIDGASRFGILHHVMLPLARPALGAAGTLAFVGSWNEFVAGSVMVDAPWLRPIQPLIYGFIGFFGREWGPLTAAATLAIIPILVVFALLGRLIVSGLTKGSVKG